MLLSEAYRSYRASPTNIMWSTIAICEDGSLAAAIWDDELTLDKETRILKHESRVSDWGGTGDGAGDREWFRLLPQALANQTPIRLIVAVRDKARDKAGRAKAEDFDPRPDLIGRVKRWDGTHLIIEFAKPK
jgi:hypothetical protein